MRTTRTGFITLVVFCASTLAIIAQEKERIISGQVRVRSELDGRRMFSDEAVLAHLIRSRIRATVRPAAGITVLAEVQDSRYWGQSDPVQGRGTTDASADALDMHQAWAQCDSIFGTPIVLRVGRQEMSFANERLVSVSNWSNRGRTFDAARATWLGDGFNVDVFGSRTSAPSERSETSQNFYGLWAAWRPDAALAIDVYGLRDDDTRELQRGVDSGLSALARYTAGAYARMSLDPVDAEIEGALQRGALAQNDSVARNSVEAFMASATIGVTLDRTSKTRAYVLATVISGDGSSDDGRVESFNLLFGTKHRYYGLMDVVPVFGSHGLVDLSAGLSSTPLKSLRLLFETHLMKPQRGGERSYGTEIDATMYWRSTPALEVSGGGGVFLSGDALADAVSDKIAYWLYLAGQFDF